MADHEEGAMRSRYDFSGGVRGQHRDRFPPDSSFAVVDLDLLERFPNPEAVNDALRAYLAQQEEETQNTAPVK